MNTKSNIQNGTNNHQHHHAYPSHETSSCLSSSSSSTRIKRRHPDSTTTATVDPPSNHRTTNAFGPRLPPVPSSPTPCINSQDDNDSASLWHALLHPHYDELSRQFPTTFGRAWQTVQRDAQTRRVAYTACWTDDFALALTCALLKRHWNLTLRMPDNGNFLCPPVPNRYFLVHWWHRHLGPMLRSDASGIYFTHAHRGLSGQGLDVGTGASCIYPLLLATVAHNQNFRVWACDVHPEAVDWACRNVVQNNLQHAIRPLLVPLARAQQQHSSSNPDRCDKSPDNDDLSWGGAGGPLDQCWHAISQAQQQQESTTSAVVLPPRLDFVFSNPPFYDTEEERTRVRQGDGRTRTAMTSLEGVYPGGEVGFGLDILLDQVHQCVRYHHQHRQEQQQSTIHHDHGLPGWTVLMCGKKSSWTRLVQVLTQLLGISRVSTTEFGPGQWTRWFVAWTWHTAAPEPMSPLAETTESCQFDIPGNVSRDDLVQRWHQYAREARLVIIPMDRGGDDHHPGRQQRPPPVWQFGLAADPAAEEDQLSKLWLVDDARHLPAPVASLIGNLPWSVRRALLPACGAFYIRVSIAVNATTSNWMIQARAYVHLRQAKRIVVQIQHQMAGEIQQTNRKWRRRRKQQQQLSASSPTERSAVNSDEPDRMDEG